MGRSGLWLLSWLWLIGWVPAAAGSRDDASWAPTLVLPAKDPLLQQSLETMLQRQPFLGLARQGLISVALVDLSDPTRLRFAGVQERTMRYAASLPKIAILLGAFDRVVRGKLSYSAELREQLTAMIRVSSNSAATNTLRLVGFQHLGALLQDPRLLLYDRVRGGGLWVGKDYGGGLGYGPRDPLHGLSHGATAEQVARFLVMMDQGGLINPWVSAEVKRILSKPAIQHKFVKGLAGRPGISLFRKSGTWKHWHCDAALVERSDGRRYVAVGLVEHERGGRVLEELIRGLDDLITRGDPVPRVPSRQTVPVISKPPIAR